MASFLMKGTMDGASEMKPITPTEKSSVRRRVRRRAFISLGALSVLAAPQQSEAQFLYQGWALQQEPARQFQLSPEAFLFSTQSNYDREGNLGLIENLNGILRSEAGLSARYGLNERVTLFGRFAWAVVTVDQATSTYSGMGYGLTDQNAGVSIRLLGAGKTPSPFTLDLQAQVEFPLYNNQVALPSGFPLLGDSTIDVTVGPFLGWTFLSDRQAQWRFVAGSGYTWRSDSFSQAIPYSVAIENEVADTGLTLRAAARGQVSLRSDPRGLAGETGASTEVNGGSFTANAVNPSLAVLEGRLGYQFAPTFEAHAFGGATLWGQHVPGGFTVGLGVTTQFGSHLRQGRSKPTSAEYNRSNQGFMNYSLEGKVSRVNDKLNLVKIDKGSLAGVEAGQIFDLFSVRENGALGESVARARATSVQANETALVVIEYFREVWIDEGFIARRVIE